MARQANPGLTYFSFETGFFNDRKIRRLLKSHGSDGIVIYNYLLCEIYKDKGYYLEYDKDLAFDVSDSLRSVTEEIVNNVIEFCLDCNLFNKKLFTEKHILTSSGIQSRWENTIDLLKRKSTINSEFIAINSEEIGINSEETPLNSEITTTKKEKKRKEEKERKNIPQFLEFKEYALLNQNNTDLHSLELKYKAWVENGWKTGKNTPIKNWKSTLLNTLKYLQLDAKNQQNNETPAEKQARINAASIKERMSTSQGNG